VRSRDRLLAVLHASNASTILHLPRDFLHTRSSGHWYRMNEAFLTNEKRWNHSFVDTLIHKSIGRYVLKVKRKGDILKVKRKDEKDIL
jgi:hypothetical protein